LIPSQCLNGRRECHYRPSRRGGARRGIRAAESLSRKQAPVVPPYVHSIDNGAYLSPLSSETTDINSKRSFLPEAIINSLSLPFIVDPVLHNIIGINSSLDGLQDPDIIINHGAAMGTAPSPVETPTVTLRAYRCDQDL
jgi:hypothetical protein